jgi:HEAT repeat protein
MQERLCGHTAGEWYGFYHSPRYFQGDLVSAVTAALREVLATRGETANFAADPWLTTLLTTDPRETVRCLAAIKLGLGKLAEGEPALLAALHDESETVRRSAALALLALDTVRGLAAVVAGSRHGHAVRTQAAHRLRGHGEGAIEAVPGLLYLLRDPNINWRSHAAAAAALAAIGEPAIPALVQVFEYGEPRLRYFAAMALKELDKTPGLLAAIEGVLKAGQNAN